MVCILIDIPIFSSPQKSFGYAYGEVDLSILPIEKSLLSWPAEWLSFRTNYFIPENSLVWSVTPIKNGLASHQIQLCGVVLDSEIEAKQCADFFEKKCGLRVILWC